MEDWLANAYDGMSRRQFLARMTAAGIGESIVRQLRQRRAFVL